MKFQLNGNYFHGQYSQPTTSGINSVEKTIKVVSPANLNETLWECPVEYKHVNEVIESANNGFEIWRRYSVEQRIEIINRIKENVLTIKDQMAKAIALETGKPLWEAETEVNAVVGKVDITINESLPRIKNKTIENISPNTNGHVIYKPIGPCFVIGPFNFPCHLANTQLLSALISGNSVIFKPSEKTCYSSQLLFDCYEKAGFPKGVINLIQGGGEIARRIVADKTIKLIFFTGSKDVGVSILSNAAHDPTKLIALELGGKNTSILHDDANLDFALEELIKASFLTAGQRCTSTSLIAIHKNIVDEFVSRFHEVSKKIIVDHPIDFEHKPFMGPLIDKKALDTFLLYVGMAKREGIEEIMRGKQLEKKYPGHYVSPSVHLAKGLNPESHFLTHELFGPSCTFIPYDTIDEAIAITNSTEYGLAASIFTKNQGHFQKCINEIDAGLVNLNRSTCGASAKLPFGGVKYSGNYRPAAVSMIDSCVYQMASLESQQDTPQGIESIPGLKL